MGVAVEVRDDRPRRRRGARRADQAGTEEASRAGEDHRAHGIVVLRRGAGGGEIAQQLLVDRVGGRAVERQQPDAGVVVSMRTSRWFLRACPTTVAGGTQRAAPATGGTRRTAPRRARRVVPMSRARRSRPPGASARSRGRSSATCCRRSCARRTSRTSRRRCRGGATGLRDPAAPHRRRATPAGGGRRPYFPRPRRVRGDARCNPSPRARSCSSPISSGTTRWGAARHGSRRGGVARRCAVRVLADAFGSFSTHPRSGTRCAGRRRRCGSSTRSSRGSGTRAIAITARSSSSAARRRSPAG